MKYTKVLRPQGIALEGFHRWQRYVSDALLAFGSICLFTGAFVWFHPPLKTPDSLLLYLLIILALASTRGSYAALLASFAAFFAFDFFFVSPVYSLVVTKFADFLALIVFLVTAILIGQLTSALRRYVEQVRRKERETRILYELVRTTNCAKDMERQLQIFVQTIEEVFASWGVRECRLLLPNAEGRLAQMISATCTEQQVTLSSKEQAEAARVMTQGLSADVSDDVLPASLTCQPRYRRGTRASTPPPCYTRLIPLKKDQEVLGVLRFLIVSDTQFPAETYNLGIDHGLSNPQAVFFRMFLEQAVALIERGHFQRESLRIEVLQQTDTLRAALLSSVSHDLRTPLSAIMTAATCLQQQEARLDEEVQQSLSLLIEQEARRLNRLVENLLDMSRIESGALQPQKACYLLDEVVRDVMGRLYPLLQGREVHLSLPDNLPGVELDYMQIDQVITNLLENAARYTPAGSPVDIDLSLQHAWVQVRVEDRGPGIPATERERIFDPFYRVLGNSHGKAQGSGLGLAVCRGLVQAHGGHIWAEPREGGGTSFCFTLPLQRDEVHEA